MVTLLRPAESIITSAYERLHKAGQHTSSMIGVVASVALVLVHLLCVAMEIEDSK